MGGSPLLPLLTLTLTALLLTLTAARTTQNTRNNPQHWDYQDSPYDLPMEYLVPEPDYPQQVPDYPQVVELEDILSQMDPEQAMSMYSQLTGQAGDYDDYMESVRELQSSQPAKSPLHKKDSEYLQYQPNPALTNIHLPKDPPISQRKTARTPVKPSPAPGKHGSSLAASLRGMAETPLFRPEQATDPVYRGRRKRSTTALRPESFLKRDSSH